MLNSTDVVYELPTFPKNLKEKALGYQPIIDDEELIGGGEMEQIEPIEKKSEEGGSFSDNDGF